MNCNDWSTLGARQAYQMLTHCLQVDDLHTIKTMASRQPQYMDILHFIRIDDMNVSKDTLEWIYVWSQGDTTTCLFVRKGECSLMIDWPDETEDDRLDDEFMQYVKFYNERNKCSWKSTLLRFASQSKNLTAREFHV